MFGSFLVLVVTAAGGFIAAFGAHATPSARGWGVAVGIAASLALLAVVAKILLSDGVADWAQGGVVGIERDNERTLAWSDWAVLVTRRGRVDTASGMLHLERRLLFGLIPAGTVARPLREFYRVEVLARAVHRQRRRHRYHHRHHHHHGSGGDLLDMFSAAGNFLDDGWGTWGGSWGTDQGRLVGHEFAVNLVDRQANRVCLLDLCTSASDTRGEALVSRLRSRLEGLLQGDGRRPAGEVRAPEVDDFEAWRAKQAKGRGSGGPG